MKKILFSTLSALLLLQTGFALSPLDRSSKEISDIVRNPQLRRMLPPTEVILDIRRIPSGYVLTTNRFQVIVDVIYGPSARGGEQQEEVNLEFHEPTETK